jgi:putative mRNA 3-end processing factor
LTKNGLVRWLNGVILATKETKLFFDPVPGGVVDADAYVLISHAHADHIYGFATPAVKCSTLETLKIYERVRKRAVENFKEVRINEKIKLGDVEVTPLNAGHVLGSAQFKIFLPEKTILYTGDLNGVDTLTTRAADKVECDELIIEATYGHPSYIFPPRDKVYINIVKWAANQIKNGRVPTFHVYALGKAQEIIRLFNIYTTLHVITHPAISTINETYSSSGIKLKCKNVFDDDSSEILEKEPCVCVTTPNAGSPAQGRAVKAVATGWAVRAGYENFSSFPLSSHADFSQLIQFVRETKARTVYTFTGYTETFAAYLRKKLKVDARPIPQIPQKQLFRR